MEVKSIIYNGVELITKKELIRLTKSNQITIGNYLKLFDVPYLLISKTKLYDFKSCKSIIQFIEQKKSK